MTVDDVIERVEDRLEKIESYGELFGAPADVKDNPALALIQVALKAQHDELEWVLSVLEEHTDE